MAKQSFVTGQVLTAQQVNDLQTNDFNQTVSAKTASYTLVAADKGTRITMSSTSATTITVNTGLFAAGDTLFIQNLNTGVCTITAGTATVDTSASLALAQHEGGTLYFTSAGVSTFFKAAGAAAASGGMTLISTTTLTSSSTSISSIPQTHKHLFCVYKGVGSSSGSLRLKINNVSNYYNYSAALLTGGAFTDGTSGSDGDGFVIIQQATGFHGTTWIPNYALSDVKFQNTQGARSATQTLTTGFWNDTAAITSLQYQSGGTLTGTVYLYGVS